MSETIRQFVERRLREGARALIIYGEVQRKFPHKRGSWNYISSIERNYLRHRDLNPGRLNMSDSDITISRWQLVEDTAAEMMLAAGEALWRHGRNSESEAILGAALAFFVVRLDEEMLPGFKRRFMRMLENE